MTDAPVDVAAELNNLGAKLQELARAALCAIRERDEETLIRILDERDPLVERVRVLAQKYAGLVKACAALAEAARLESELVPLACAQRDDIGEEIQIVRQRIALRNTYGLGAGDEIQA
jgi:hypothetical protein